MKRQPLLFFTLLGMLLLLPALLWAATVERLHLDDLVERSHRVLVADVLAVEARAEGTRVMTTVTLRVEETWKGAHQEELVLRQPGGRDLDADLATFIPGLPNFEPHTRILLFLTETGESTFAVTGMAQGFFRIVKAPDQFQEVVLPRLHGLHFIDGRSEARPGTAKVRQHEELYSSPHFLDDLRFEVQRLLATEPGESLR